ncbi:CRE-TTR-12 protein [Caenorhabditis remanei]|uniref:CRE-TTR-12 protein n=1 Tax=Caenorhabditis remanei TaxID=31234 RepID=E3MF46_CAERE|nr:CRE-TTR-12 protein [Caenorhabditis remanei]
MHFLFPSLLFLALSNTCSAGCASVQVKGQLMCNGQPFVKEHVQLWEPKLLGDELWDDMQTGQDGKFQIFSHGFDVTIVDIPFLGFGIHPYLWIPNYCGSVLIDGKRCTKNILNIAIPEGYINPCQPDVYVYDIGRIDMESAESARFNWVLKLMGQHYQCRNY